MDGDLVLLHLGERLHHLHRVWSGDVRRDLAEVEHDASGVHGVGIWRRWVLFPTLNIFVGEALHTHCFQSLVYVAHVGDCDRIHREPSNQRAPFGGHVRDGEPRVHRKRSYAWASELDRRVHALIVVVEAAERDDDVLARGAFR